MADLGSWVKASAHRFDEWEIDFPDSCQYRHIGREDGTSDRTSPICIVVTDDMSPVGDAELDAHANLIAAAPKLLAALLAARDALNSIKHHDTHSIVASCDTAINSARGLQ